MSLTLQEKFDIMLEALEALGSYTECDCGCPDARSARIAPKPVISWAIARDALIKIGHTPKVYPNE